MLSRMTGEGIRCSAVWQGRGSDAQPYDRGGDQMPSRMTGEGIRCSVV